MFTRIPESSWNDIKIILSQYSYKIYKIIWENTMLLLWWFFVSIVCGAISLRKLCSEISYLRRGSKWLCLNILKIVGTSLEYLRRFSTNHSRKLNIISEGENDIYLERYYLFLKNREKCSYNIFLHRFVKDDTDDIHDHPWGFFHIIISGGYWEYITVNEDGETLDQGIKKVWREPGYCNIVNADYKHRIVLGPQKPWTLFIPFKKEKDWGFWVPLVWQKNGPCIEGSIKEGHHLNCTNWKKINHTEYLKKKLSKSIGKDN